MAQNPNFYVKMQTDLDSDNLDKSDDEHWLHDQENLEERREEEERSDLSSCDEEPIPSKANVWLLLFTLHLDYIYIIYIFIYWHISEINVTVCK